MARTPFRWTLHVALSGALLAGVGCGEGDTESQSSRTNNGNQPTGDTVPPTISITQPQSFATLEPMALTVIGVAADNEGLDRVDIRVDDGEFELASGLDNWSFAIPFLSVGLHTIAARATDLAGNATTVATSVNVRENGGDDTEPPTVTVLQPLDGATIGAGLFTVRGTASDNVAVESVFVGINLSGQQLATGTTNWQIVLDGSLLEQGAQTILVSAIDSSGNRSALQSFSINIDRDIPQALVEGAVAPISTRDSATFFVSGENVASYAYTLDDGPMSGAIPAGTPLELLDLDDGFHVLEVIGLDPIGVSQVTPTEFSWLVSTTPDEASIDPLPELPIATDALTVTLLDADGFRYRVDGGDWSDRISAPSRSAQVQLSGLTDGAHRIEVLGSDGLGNEQSDPEIAVWAVDRTPPPAPLLIEFPPSRVPGNSVSLRVGGPDVEAFNYRLNGGALLGPGSGSLTLTNLMEGVQVLELTAVDAAGNLGGTTTVAWEMVTDPTVRLTESPPEEVAGPEVTYVVAGEGFTSFEYRVIAPGGSATIPLVASLGTLELDLSPVITGEYTVEFRPFGTMMIDPPWNAHRFTVEQSPPLAALTNLPARPTELLDLEVYVGGAEVVSYVYELDGGNPVGPTSVSTPITAMGLASGQHALDVFGIDFAGNIQPAPTSIDWSVNLTAPVPLINGAPSGETAQSSFTVSVSGAQVSRYRWRLDGGVIAAPVSVTQPLELDSLSTGPHTLEIFAENALGVFSEPQEFAFRVTM